MNTNRNYRGGQEQRGGEQINGEGLELRRWDVGWSLKDGSH